MAKPKIGETYREMSTGEELKVTSWNGAYYYVVGNRHGEGRIQADQFENPKLYTRIKKK